jgi:Ca-activated chloride channel homolog
MRFLSKYPALLIAILSLLLISIPARAQEPSQPAETSSQKQTVRLNVIVTDSSNHEVTDLRQEDFRVLEDGKPQAVTYFSREELPVSYGLAVDASGSLRSLLAHVIETGKGVVAGNKPGDEAFVMRFISVDAIKIYQGFTSNKDALADALDEIYIEGGFTALLDAANRSIDFLKKYRRNDEGTRRRQAIVMITDGEDRGSSIKADALLNRLRGEEIQFFLIGLTKMTNLQGSPEKAAKLLNMIAEASGGRVFFPKSPAEIPAVLEEIRRDLHTQYVIGYTPSNVIPDGAFRKVQITVAESPGHKKLNVITRSGYTAPRP